MVQHCEARVSRGGAEGAQEPEVEGREGLSGQVPVAGAIGTQGCCQHLWLDLHWVISLSPGLGSRLPLSLGHTAPRLGCSERVATL